MRLLVPPEDLLKQHGIVLSEEKSHYLLKVLRAGKGDRFTAIDGRGRSYLAEITDVVRPSSSGKAPPPAGRALRAVIGILGEPDRNIEDRTVLVLGQALLKGEKMDLVIQKATELGIGAIHPLVTERSILRETRKVPRWRKIAEEAAEQSGRSVIPEICDPQPLAAFLASRGSRPGLVLWEAGGVPIAEALAGLNPRGSCQSPSGLPACPGRVGEPLVLIVGPEGGFSGAEVMEAQSRGFILVTLGSRTLRAETAAIAGVALAQYILEHDRP